MKKFYIVSTILNETNLKNTQNLTPEEKSKRQRMIKRMAALGIAAGIGVSAVELWHNPAARVALKQALQSKGLWPKVTGVTKQVWKPMAIGAASDLVIEPVNTMIAQKMEDRLQKKNKVKK